MAATEVPDEPRRRVDHQTGAADDEGIRLADGRHGPGEHFLVQPFLVQNNIRLDDAAALGAAGHAGTVGNEVHIVERAALHAVVAQGAAVELVNGLGPRSLMQAVDVLGDDGLQPALPLQLCQPQVGSVGLRPLHNELIPVEPVELLGVLLPEGVAQDGLGRVIVLLVVQAVHAAEIGDAAFGGDPRAAKKDDAVALGNDFFQCRNHKRNASFPADRCVLDSSSITQIQRKGSVSFFDGIVPLLSARFRQTGFPAHPADHAGASRFPRAGQRHGRQLHHGDKRHRQQPQRQADRRPAGR